MSINRLQPDTSLPKEKRIRVYTALLTQTGTNAPTATVLQNTLGETLTWTRNDIGEYNGTILTPQFTVTETALFLTKTSSSDTFVPFRLSTTVIRVETRDMTGTHTDGILANTPIEIRVYE